MSPEAPNGGIVYLVGAGPGDPGRLTVVVHNVGKRGRDSASSRQEDIHALLVQLGSSARFVSDGVLDIAAEGARDVLPTGLAQLGCAVDTIRAYRTVSDGTGADHLRSARAGVAATRPRRTDAGAARSCAVLR